MGNGIWRYGGVINTMLRVDFLKDVFKSNTRDFRLDKPIDCTYQIRVRPILETMIRVDSDGKYWYEKKWPDKRSEQKGSITIMPNNQGPVLNKGINVADFAGRSDL